MLVNQFGQEIKQNKPVLAEISVQTIRDRYSNYPSHGLTPERLATILKEADQGDVYRQSELFEEMEEKDIHLGSVLGTRKLAVVGLTGEILPASDADEDKEIASKAKEMIEYIENWEDGLLDMLDAIGKGFAGQEIMWDVSEGQVWCKELKWIHQKMFTFSGPPSGALTSPLLNVPRLITDQEQVWGEELLPYKFIFHRYKARSGITSRGGLCRPCSYMYLFKNYDIKDWLVFNELYSVPMRIGKYRAGAGKEEIETLKKAVFNLGVDAAAVVSDNTIIELLESKVRGETSAFKDLAEFCERSMTKAVLGHTGSSDSTPGKLGGESEASDVRQDILEADAKSIMKTIKFQLLKPWVVYNFGPDKGVPSFKLHFETEENLKEIADTYGVLVRDVNFKGITVKHIHERFNIPVPQEGEEVVTAAEVLGISQGIEANQDDLTPDVVGKRLETSQATVLNGAQVTAATAIVVAVAAGQIPRDAGLGQLKILFNLDDAQAEQVMGSAGTKTPTTPNPRPEDVMANKSAVGGVSNPLDAMVDRLQDEAPMDDFLKPVEKLINESSSMEELRDKLLDLYAGMDVKDLGNLLQRAFTAAEMAGRFDARGKHAGS